MLKLLPFIFFSLTAFSQPLHQGNKLSHADTLRGSNGIYRQKWNVLQYNITIEPDYNQKSLAGINRLSFFDNGTTIMQIDLQEPMLIDSIFTDNKPVTFNREGNVYWVEFRKTIMHNGFKPGVQELVIYFHGKPVEAKSPPWDGGWIWKKDKNGNPWISVACQGLGASVWYPCKDIQSDEPDNGAVLNIITPDTLVGIGNGRLQSNSSKNNKTTWTWIVKNPINNYNIVPYIGKYEHFNETYKGLKGDLSMDYWVLSYNLNKAKQQFSDAPKMMKAFEYWFGPYPFYQDGYKLVEAPHLGMEHQSNIAYGNGYKNGYMGRDLSASGWGLKWDFIIIHESGHEWFANNITTKDIADMWVHEGFTNYSETLFTEYYWGKNAGTDYIAGLRDNIQNDIPIIGIYGVNKEGSGDMYYKGANLIHLVRQLINNDEKFRRLLISMNKDFYHQTVTTQQIENYISNKSGIKLSKVFDQYLRTVNIPILEYRIVKNKLQYRWSNCIDGFDMPLKIVLNSENKVIKPATYWKEIKISEFVSLKIDKNYYVNTSALQ